MKKNIYGFLLIWLFMVCMIGNSSSENMEDYVPVRGIVHVHSSCSDGKYDIEGIFHRAKDSLSKPEFVVVTEHNDAFASSGEFSEKIINKCLEYSDPILIPGEEITLGKESSKSQIHFLAIGFDYNKFEKTSNMITESIAKRYQIGDYGEILRTGNLDENIYLPTDIQELCLYFSKILERRQVE